MYFLITENYRNYPTIQQKTETQKKNSSLRSFYLERGDHRKKTQKHSSRTVLWLLLLLRIYICFPTLQQKNPFSMRFRYFGNGTCVELNCRHRFFVTNFFPSRLFLLDNFAGGVARSLEKCDELIMHDDGSEQVRGKWCIGEYFILGIKLMTWLILLIVRIMFKLFHWFRHITISKNYFHTIY